MRLSSIVLLSLCSVMLHAANNEIERQQIQQRIQPIGKVRIQEDGTIRQNKKKLPVPVEKNNGQVIYEQYCIICHRDGLAGAPKFRDAKEWKLRSLGKTVDDLVSSATKGLNAMPAKGTCYNCSDADLKAAIEYMLHSHD